MGCCWCLTILVLIFTHRSYADWQNQLVAASSPPRGYISNIWADYTVICKGPRCTRIMAHTSLWDVLLWVHLYTNDGKGHDWKQSSTSRMYRMRVIKKIRNVSPFVYILKGFLSKFAPDWQQSGANLLRSNLYWTKREQARIGLDRKCCKDWKLSYCCKYHKCFFCFF